MRGGVVKERCLSFRFIFVAECGLYFERLYRPVLAVFIAYVDRLLAALNPLPLYAALYIYDGCFILSFP